MAIKDKDGGLIGKFIFEEKGVKWRAKDKREKSIEQSKWPEIIKLLES